MILLKTQDYYKLEQSLKTVEINHLFAQTVIEQKMDGEIYADDPQKPSTVYVKHSYGMALLYGRTDNETFNQNLVNYLLNKEKKRNAGEWLQVFPHEWNTKLEELLAGHFAEPTANPSENKQKVIQSTRVNFRFNKSKYISVIQTITPELKLVRTTAEQFSQITGTVVPRYFWRNKREFGQQSVGFSLMDGDDPVSTAFASFVHDPQLELGIETRSESQGLGLAQITCSALIDYCISNNYEPVWACRLENTGSYKLAQKLGFEPIRMIPYYQLPWQSYPESEVNKAQTVEDMFVYSYHLHKI